MSSVTLSTGTPNAPLAPPDSRGPPDVIGTCFLLLVVLAPLPLGGNRPLFWSVLALLSAACLATYALLVLFRRRKLAFSLNGMMVFGLPAVLALGWGVLQSCSLVPEALRNPVWAVAAQAFDRPLTGAISLDPSQSITGVMRLMTYLAVFVVALQLGRERRFAVRFLHWFAGAAFCYALYGLIDHTLGFDRILWMKRWAYEGFLTSTFVNRNSYATYAALGLLCMTALLFNASRDIFKAGRARRQHVLALVETLTGPAMLPLIGALVVGIALLQTGSRAGAFSALCGLIVLILALAHARMLQPRQAIGAIAALVGTAVLFVLLTGSAVVDRLDSATMSTDKSARAELYALTWRAIGDQPVLGTGLGTFPEVFSIYRTASFDPFVLPTKTHNSYLSNALEIGIPATLLLLLSLAMITFIALRGLRVRRRGQVFPALGLASIAAVALHSMVDFSLEIPAVAVGFAGMAGVCCAQSFRSRNKRGRAA